jgi:hypothetical protein
MHVHLIHKSSKPENSLKLLASLLISGKIAGVQIEIINSTNVPANAQAPIKRIDPPNLFEKIGYRLFPRVILLIIQNSKLSYYTKYFTEIVSFVLWQKKSFGAVNFISSKEELFSLMQSSISSNASKFEVYEFGVAHGYMTYWFLNSPKSRNSQIVQYAGFDTFEGLDREYRNYPVGSFTNENKFPAIIDPRLTWHKGRIQETITLIARPSHPSIWIFDLDLPDATISAWNTVEQLIKPGDILYFDEGFDSEEFEIVKLAVSSVHKLIYIGTTLQAIAFKVGQ